MQTQDTWAETKVLMDVVREPVLILGKDLHVMVANESFYRTFQVEPKDTEGTLVYKLGNGQWNIPALRKLLEDILPQNAFFKGFEVDHDFPVIGRKVMVLNARRLDSPDIILLAIEDASEIMMVAETLAGHANQMDAKLAERTSTLEAHIGKLEKELNELKKGPAAPVR